MQVPQDYQRAPDAARRRMPETHMQQDHRRASDTARRSVLEMQVHQDYRRAPNSARRSRTPEMQVQPGTSAATLTERRSQHAPTQAVSSSSSPRSSLWNASVGVSSSPSPRSSLWNAGSTVCGNAEADLRHEAVAAIRDALLQLEPLSLGEDLWRHHINMLTELESLHAQVAEQSRRNKHLQREVDEQQKILATIADLELENRLFASQIPQGMHVLEQKDSTIGATEDMQQIIQGARRLWKRHHVVSEERFSERAKRKVLAEQEEADRDMIPMLQRKIDETREATNNARARIKGLSRLKEVQLQWRELQHSQSPPHSPHRRFLCVREYTPRYLSARETR